MAIPHLPEVRKALWAELEKAGGTGEAQDIIESLAQRFHLAASEREVRDNTGQKTFDHRVHSAVAQSRKAGWMEWPEESGRSIWKLTPIYFEDNPRELRPVESADRATEIALSFLKEHYQFIPQQPIKAAKEDNIWLVEIDVGLLRARIAKIKIDAKTATILEYSIPSEAV